MFRLSETPVGGMFPRVQRSDKSTNRTQQMEGRQAGLGSLHACLSVEVLHSHVAACT